MHKDISAVLNVMEIIYEIEKSIDIFKVDVYVPKTRKVIEINGPDHYIKSSDHLKGGSIFKYKCLKMLGYSTSVIRYE